MTRGFWRGVTDEMTIDVYGGEIKGGNRIPKERVGFGKETGARLEVSSKASHKFIISQCCKHWVKE